jgi:crotonobetainyl-CoA:carnitine CoA-transferase CaiB-like acyl-CoA transferase
MVFGGNDMKKVLDDIRVLDFGRFIACPYCGMILGDMGAEVIRIDRTGGEEDRTVGLQGPNGENTGFASYARNKKGITLNLLNNEPAQEVLADLVKVSDVVIHNFSPYAADLMGLTYEKLSAIKSDIILSAVSCYGSDGPYAKKTGFDPIAQTMSGAMAITGFPGGDPLRSQVPWVDYSTAMANAIGTLLALRHRDRTGQGQMVDLALLGTAVSFMGPVIAEAEALGRVRPRVGNRGCYIGPSDLYRCKDGYVYISTLMNTLWARLLKIVGHEELLEDDELYNDFQRFELRDRVDPLIEEWMAGHTVDEVLDKMEEARIPCGRYLEVEEVSKDPHIQARGMIGYTDMEVEGLERMPVCGTPFRLSRTPGTIERRAPRVGEHNMEIYQGVLGYSDERMADLEQQGII